MVWVYRPHTMASSRERIIELGHEIGNLRQRLQETEPLRRKLSECEAELDSLLGGHTRRHDTARNGNGAGRLVEGSMASRIVTALEKIAPKAAKANQVQKELGAKSLNSVRGTLLRLAESDLIERAERGQYRAKGKTM
jgi:hypothetical protein